MTYVIHGKAVVINLSLHKASRELDRTLISRVVGQSLQVDDPKVTIIPEYHTIQNLQMKLQGFQVSRIRRETNGIQPMHTLTRHTYFSHREITSIAPTNLRRYLTVEQVGIKWVPRT